MAKFRPDGSQFTITSNGPCNIWGLVLNGEGEAFIQEANDFGYPVMPFHESANYPGCSDRQWKSYAPEFPGTAPDFRMGGTGLSGLALTDKTGPFPEPWRDVMLVPIRLLSASRRSRCIAMVRAGGLKSFRTSQFRVTNGFAPSRSPWVRTGVSTSWIGITKSSPIMKFPRTHPDRDKTRGRIWRVKATVCEAVRSAGFYEARRDQLIAKLGVSRWRRVIWLGRHWDRTKCGGQRLRNVLDRVDPLGHCTANDSNVALGTWRMVKERHFAAHRENTAR
jgi:hypothetical protein